MIDKKIERLIKSCDAEAICNEKETILENIEKCIFLAATEIAKNNKELIKKVSTLNILTGWLREAESFDSYIDTIQRSYNAAYDSHRKCGLSPGSTLSV